MKLFQCCVILTVPSMAARTDAGDSASIHWAGANSHLYANCDSRHPYYLLIRTSLYREVVCGHRVCPLAQWLMSHGEDKYLSEAMEVPKARPGSLRLHKNTCLPQQPHTPLGKACCLYLILAHSDWGFAVSLHSISVTLVTAAWLVRIAYLWCNCWYSGLWFACQCTMGTGLWHHVTLTYTVLMT